MEANDEPACRPRSFTVMLTGQIESAQNLPPAATVSAALMPWPVRQLSRWLFRPWERLLHSSSPQPPQPLPRNSPAHASGGAAYARFEIVAGEDWDLVDGQDGGTTQLARPGGGGGGAALGDGDDCNSSGDAVAWNHPLEAAFRSTSAFGWPQLCVAVYGVDPATGRDVPRGYGSAPLPARAGRHRLRLRLFRPRAATALGAAAGWGSGMLADFADARLPSYGVGRAATRVASGGHVDVQVDVATRDMAALGYDCGGGGGR